MRNAVFALLVAAPSLLVGWLLGSGFAAPATTTALGGLEGFVSPPPGAGPAAAPSASGPAAPPGDDDAGLLALFNGDLGVAKVKEKVELFDDRKLFDYIDGGAPAYLAHHFRTLAAAEMAGPEGSELTCDVYDMRTAQDAGAMFDAERSGAAKPVDGWAEALQGNLSFVFHRGRYYVKLTAFDKKAEAHLQKLAEVLKDRMAP